MRIKLAKDLRRGDETGYGRIERVKAVGTAGQVVALYTVDNGANFLHYLPADKVVTLTEGENAADYRPALNVDNFCKY